MSDTEFAMAIRGSLDRLAAVEKAAKIMDVQSSFMNIEQPSFFDAVRAELQSIRQLVDPSTVPEEQIDMATRPGGWGTFAPVSLRPAPPRRPAEG